MKEIDKEAVEWLVEMDVLQPNPSTRTMTAVELFIEQLEVQGESWENVSIGRIQISIKVEDYLKLKEQAKEMEKEQSELYAEFAVLNNRSGNPIIPFNEFINIDNL
jgi:hypothetical protein